MSTPGQGPLSPIPITSRPVRARLDEIKAELSAAYQRQLGRDAYWNEVIDHLIRDHAELHGQDGGAELPAYLAHQADAIPAQVAQPFSSPRSGNA